MRIRECRIITNDPWVQLYRGRAATEGDPAAKSSIVWEPMFRLRNSSISGIDGFTEVLGMTYTGPQEWPYNRGGAIVCAGRQLIVACLLNDEHSMNRGKLAGIIVQPKDTAGMPEVNKQWLEITYNGKKIGANNTIGGYYRVDEAASYSTGEAGIAVSPKTVSLLSTTTGRALQLRTNFDGATGTEPTELNQIEVRFRELPTYKRQYQLLIELADGQSGTRGSRQPRAAVQLTALEADHGAGTLAFVDPLERSYNVTLDDLKMVGEYIQEGTDYPVLLFQATVTQV